MSNSVEQTFDEFLTATDLRSWDRNYMKWYGSIVIKPDGLPDPFSFTLVVYLTDAHEKRSGICHVLEWSQERQNLCVTKSVHCAEPFHEDNRLKGMDKAKNDLLFLQEPTDSVPSAENIKSRSRRWSRPPWSVASLARPKGVATVEASLTLCRRWQHDQYSITE